MPAGGSLGEFGQVGRRTEGWEFEALILALALVLTSGKSLPVPPRVSVHQL